jgi:hypothetical protein
MLFTDEMFVYFVKKNYKKNYFNTIKESTSILDIISGSTLSPCTITRISADMNLMASSGKYVLLPPSHKERPYSI